MNTIPHHQSSLNFPSTREILTRNIDWVLSQTGLRLRNANLWDIPNLDKLAASRYDENTVKEMSNFASYRFIKYGNVFIVENNIGKIVWCIYEIQLQWSVSFATRLIVDKEYEGLWIPRILTEQTYISALDSWSRIRKGIIARDNVSSHITHLNKLGWKYTGIILGNLEWVSDHFEVEVDLDDNLLAISWTDEESLVQKAIHQDSSSNEILIAMDDISAIVNFFNTYPLGYIGKIIRPGLMGKWAFFLWVMNRNTTMLMPTSLSIGWVTLEDRDHWEPISPEIIKNAQNLPSTEPQAWFIEDRWEYNLRWMRTEAKFCNKKVPKDDQWLNFMQWLEANNMASKNHLLAGDKFFNQMRPGVGISNWWTRGGNTVFLREDYLHPWLYKDLENRQTIRFLSSSSLIKR